MPQHGTVRAGTTIVVVPSLTLDNDELSKITGAVHFEERLLFLLQMLRQPDVRIVYVVSEPLDSELVTYALDISSVLAVPGTRSRLTILSCDDAGCEPLTGKIMRHPILIDRIRNAIPDPRLAYLATYNSTELERQLALALDIPLFACDPELADLGTKSGSRQLFRAADVPIPFGFEDVRTPEDLSDALRELKSARPGLKRAVLKLNESFAGGGNALFSFDGSPAGTLRSWLSSELSERLTFAAEGETATSYLAKLRKMGGIVEEFMETPHGRSPSVQIEIDPSGSARVISGHDQLLSGNLGQVFTGCTFPARDSYRGLIQTLGLRAGQALAECGVTGQLSIDFVVDDPPGQPSRAYALEVNLRMGGATTPFFLLQGLTGGHYQPDSGDYVVLGDQPRCYVASDRIQRDSYRRLRPMDVVSLARRTGLHYDRATCKGVAFYMLGALKTVGKLGVIAIGETPEESQRLYDTMLAELTASSEQLASEVVPIR
ncbi:MAG TPA: peptide ligase PGM1-related protein [Streptosporangiaceae bacterium]|nr:peptide ligase PGM1-related protein [Streptosporangiaceae bacterium]